MYKRRIVIRNDTSGFKTLTVVPGYHTLDKEENDYEL